MKIVPFDRVENSDRHSIFDLKKYAEQQLKKHHKNLNNL